MAAQITHIVLAKEFLKRYPIAGSERDFIVGASFPDIRYLGTVKREVTHDLNVDLRDILNAPDGFSAGVRHHVLTDIVRNRFVLGHHAYSSVPNDKYLTEAFKFLEDEMLYGRLDDPQDAAKMFGEVLEPERAYGLADDEIVRWHARLSEYVSQAPSPATRRRFVLGLGQTAEMADDIERTVRTLKDNHEVAEIILDLYRDFTSRLEHD